jgi:hypothetical protein
MHIIEQLAQPREVKINLPATLISQRTEIKKMLERPVFLFAQIPKKGISLVGNADCKECQRILTKYIKTSR